MNIDKNSNDVRQNYIGILNIDDGSSPVESAFNFWNRKL